MKKAILYIVAIPSGVLTSILLSVILGYIFEFLNLINDTVYYFGGNYFLPLIAGSVLVSIPYQLAPGYKKIFGSVGMVTNLLCILYTVNTVDPNLFSTSNIFFFIGGAVTYIFTFKE